MKKYLTRIGFSMPAAIIVLLFTVHAQKTFAQIPANLIQGASKTASGLYYVIEKQGYGASPVNGQKVTINYTAMLTDGTTVSSSEESHQPMVFTLGAGAAIKALDEGVALLKVGTKAKFIIPPALAYGNYEIGKIPANSILIMEVELTNVQ